MLGLIRLMSGGSLSGTGAKKRYLHQENGGYSHRENLLAPGKMYSHREKCTLTRKVI